ncbi:hypothetical protein BGZ89_007935 [Linnemannia elongata]|nr:hypothetical protein BGZ89_007935 [Linnemannia elongata]
MSSKELLAEYAKLAAKLEHINETLQEMNAVDIAQLIDKIRVVERKMSLVYTLFKQSVYSITMQNALHEQDQHNPPSQDPDTERNTEADEQQQQYQNVTPQSQQSQSQDHRRYSQERQQYQTQSQQSDYDSSPQSQPQQPLRSSLRTSTNENSSNPNQQPTSILRNSTYRSTTGLTTGTTGTGTSRMSNAREEYQAATGNKSILALSRGHEGRSRWGNHYGYHSGSAGGGGSGGFESESHTNRPRYH